MNLLTTARKKQLSKKESFFYSKPIVIENRPIYGLDVFVNTNSGVKPYTPVQLLQKNAYQDKMNLLPVATAEIQRNKGTLEQTPGW